MQVETRALTPYMRKRVVFPMVLGLLVAGLVLRVFAERTAPLDLYPVLPVPPPRGALGELLRRMALDHSWILPLAAPLGAVALFFIVEVVIRRLWRAPQEGAALLVATFFLVMPGQESFTRITGSETLLVALFLALTGIAITLTRHPLGAFCGALLTAASTAVDPSLLVLAPAAVLGLRVRAHIPGKGRPSGALIGIMFLACGALYVGDTLSNPPPLAPREMSAEGASPFLAPAFDGVEGRRLELGLAALAALPANVWNAAPRTFLPTGYRGLAGDWPILPGLYVWLLVLALGTLLGGFSRAFWMAGLAGLATVSIPYLVPGWVPGDRPHMVLAAVPVLMWAGYLIGAFRQPVLRSVTIGVSVGLILVAYSMQQTLIPSFRAQALMLEVPVHSGLPRPDLEPDPARLALFRNRYRTGDAVEAAFRSFGLQRLEGGAQALRPGVLEDILTLRNPGEAEAPREERVLLRALPEIQERVQGLAQRAYRIASTKALESLLQDSIGVIPEIIEYQAQLPRHAEVVGLVSQFQFVLKELHRKCGPLGWEESSMILLESLVDFDPHKVAWRGLLGRTYYHLGKLDLALEVLEGVIPDLDPRSLEADLARGYLGLAQASSGQPKKGLEQLHAAWTTLRMRVIPPRGRLKGSDPEYWCVAELGLARYELAGKQAQDDAYEVIMRPLDFGLRRIPALALGGRFRLLEGKRPQALALLRELRALQVTELVEKLGGRSGRIDNAYFRRLGLQTLKTLLDPDQDRDDISAIEAELRAWTR